MKTIIYIITLLGSQALYAQSECTEQQAMEVVRNDISNNRFVKSVENIQMTTDTFDYNELTHAIVYSFNGKEESKIFGFSNEGGFIGKTNVRKSDCRILSAWGPNYTKGFK